MVSYGFSNWESPVTSGTPSVKRTMFRGANVSPLACHEIRSLPKEGVEIRELVLRGEPFLQVGFDPVSVLAEEVVNRVERLGFTPALPTHGPHEDVTRYLEPAESVDMGLDVVGREAQGVVVAPRVTKGSAHIDPYDQRVSGSLTFLGGDAGGQRKRSGHREP